MKIVTANRLADGAVVYLDTEGQWTEAIATAHRLAPTEADEFLDRARARRTEIAGAYLIDISDDGAPSGREALRETIRSVGPTVRRDLNRGVAA